MNPLRNAQVQFVEALSRLDDLLIHADDVRRHAFQSLRAPGSRADLRIVYRAEGGRVEILGFGHRDAPLDVYARLRARRDRP